MDTTRVNRVREKKIICSLHLDTQIVSSCLVFLSIVDLQTCSPDELLPTVLDQIPQDDVDNTNADYRQFERIHSLFSVCLEQMVTYKI